MNNLVYLNFINELRRNLHARSAHLQVVLGPRQVGKTTTVLRFIREHLKDHAIYVSADETFNPAREWLTEQWVLAQQQGKVLFIDEIQKCFDWAGVLKGLYDRAKRESRPVKCVLLGSSSLDIQKGLSESLTGRFQLLRVYHWNYAESKEGYGLTFDEYLRFGGYPGSYQFLNSPSWNDYVQNSIIGTVIDKDILLFHRIQNPALFRQAFEILTSYPAQELSYTKLLGSLQEKGNVELVKYYLSLYEGAFLIKALPKFSKKAHLKRSSSPKILPLAPCLPYLQIRDAYTPDEKGRVFEVMVGSQLVRTQEPLYYWREGSNEVDFILEVGRSIFAIEVKSGRKRSALGLNAFQAKFPGSKAVIITLENYQEFELDPLRFLKVRSV
jgi:predicted AAA+ superfamily ATPase